MTIKNRVTVNIKNQVAFVTLNRGDKHNALDMEMFYAIDKTIKQLKHNRLIRAIVVVGDGPDFCSGLDVKSVLKSPFNGLKLRSCELDARRRSLRRSRLGQRVLVGER